MTYPYRKLVLVFALLTLPPMAQAASPAKIKLLTESCETALALSAIPIHLRDESSVYVLKDEGYERTRDGSNGWACMVSRNHPESYIPACFDRHLTQTIMQAYLDSDVLILKGAADGEINEFINAGLASKRFSTPDKPGVSYMISRWNHMYVERSDSIVSLSPHIMSFGADLSNEELGFNGAAFKANRGLPVIGTMGPFNWIVTLTDHGSESSAVIEHCGDTIPAPQKKVIN